MSKRVKYYGYNKLSISH